MPQKQPPAITAVCLAGDVAFTSSATGAGTAAPLPARQATAPASTVRIMANIRTETLDIIPPNSITTIPSIRVTNQREVSYASPDTKPNTALWTSPLNKPATHP